MDARQIAAELLRLERPVIEARWKQADLLLREFPPAPHGVHNGSSEMLAEVAASFGRTATTLREWRDTARAFPDAGARPSGVTSWTIFVELRNHPARLRLIQKAARESWNTDRARREAGTTASRPTPVEQARAALKDPKVAREVVRDPEVEKTLWQAQVEVAAERAQKRPRETVKPLVDRPPDPWRHVSSMHVALEQVWRVWDDDASWGLLNMDEGPAGVQRELRYLREDRERLARIIAVGEAFIERTAPSETWEREEA